VHESATLLYATCRERISSNLYWIGGTFGDIGRRTMDSSRGIAIIHMEDLGTARPPSDLGRCLSSVEGYINSWPLNSVDIAVELKRSQEGKNYWSRVII